MTRVGAIAVRVCKPLDRIVDAGYRHGLEQIELAGAQGGH